MSEATLAAAVSAANDRVLILDFGSQVTQLIARRVRESGIYCEIHPFTMTGEAVEAFGAKAVILSGGPMSVTADDSPLAPAAVFELGVPVLGICYGQQAMAVQLGGSVALGDHQEFGAADLSIDAACALWPAGWDTGTTKRVWMSHGDHIDRMPAGFSRIGTSAGAPLAAIADEARRFYGVQFHPEVAHTPEGGALLRRFTHDIAGCSGDWTMSGFRQASITAIRAQVGTGRVVCGLSGGVDSAVAAVLLHEAIGEQLTCIFVDTGLMRLGEAEQVVGLFRDHYNIPLVHVDAGDLFLDALAGVIEPEQKRKTIGKLFIDVFEQEATKLGGADFLAQGTLYPDVIESISFKGPAATIKSHHNVGGLPERMRLKLVEPLRELFKDEVRALGRALGLPDAFVGRHPFPGPGLAIRIPGEITRDRVSILRKADKIYLDEIRAAGLYDQIWQAFAVLLPLKTVGVMGDARTYDWVCALRAVTSTDGMTADVFEFPPGVLPHIATRIVNQVRGINRVSYDITSKPPGTIEWE